MSALYATADEFTNWPTGLNVDDLIPGSSPAAQAAQLAVLMEQASRFVESITYQAHYARQVTRTFRCVSDTYGNLVAIPPEFPIVSVVASACQWQQGVTGNWGSLSSYPFLIERKKILVGGGGWGFIAGWGNAPAYAQLAYVAGYGNAVLTANAVQGASTLDLDDITGIQANDALTIYDGVSQETVVAATVTPAGSPTQVNGVLQQPGTITLPAGVVTQYAHNAGVRVSELPSAITTACILIASALLKRRRGAGGFVLETGGGVLDVGQDDLDVAKEMLVPFRSVIGGNY